MNAYSSDLRERVIAAAAATDLTHIEIAETFSVSLSSVEDWLRTYRHTRRVTALPAAGGKKRALQPHDQVIREAVANQPDATLSELCAIVYAKTGVTANSSMMCRELQLLNLPRKKVVARQSARNAARPSLARRTSRQNRSHLARDRRTAQIHR